MLPPPQRRAVSTEQKLTFKERQLIVREQAILDVVNRLLTAKGFDLMTMDEVAGEVGISKASLYKHFASKEALAAAALTRLMEQTRAMMEALDTTLPAVDKLKAVVRWSIEMHLKGEMPLLPSTRSSIQQSMSAHEPYLLELTRVSETLGEWIEAAQADGTVSPTLPGEIILYTIYARACDPVADFLRQGGAFADEEIVEYLVATCFDGLSRAA
ncbi:TetR/AcrR family transcriptional regulator [Comamonas sp. BIGb0124]|uniref:TetR/AcrR family transcriptional regulator n=1 Tax=Comamonas sp. BIGb0124 TaxID=2485130 RepID=UPI001F180EB2|nr:TetR/AcrR family transcriptional regulator [Comamonas sp. BIGb0124]